LKHYFIFFAYSNNLVRFAKIGECFALCDGNLHLLVFDITIVDVSPHEISHMIHMCFPQILRNPHWGPESGICCEIIYGKSSTTWGIYTVPGEKNTQLYPSD
jgi:hypothetical protein